MECNLITLLIELHFCKQSMQCNLACWDSVVYAYRYKANNQENENEKEAQESLGSLIHF